ncbi:MAG: hypothetical protein DMF90_27935, partial [Acidobacteria bacterium]
MNLWINALQPWLSLDGWRKGQTDEWRLEDLTGHPCFIGIDLAAKLDLMALVALFPPTADRTSWRVVPVVFTPDETLQDRAHRDRAPYLQWKEAGYLTAVPGTRVD